MVHAVYIHIPFCEHICSYCDFCKVYYQEKLVDEYLEQLEKEIMKNYQNDLIKSLYIGGGTPSSLTVAQLKRLFEILSIFKLTSDCEITMEANFESLDEEKIVYLKDKINRISLGIETIHPKLQNLMERNISKETIRKKITLLKENEIKNINVDIMYAMPTETLEEVKEDIEFVLSLEVTHVSAYALILEEHTKLFLQQPNLIEEELDAKMYDLIEEKLCEHGYEHYEISNYAKAGYASIHNLTYWKNDYYYGFGVGAASYLPKIRCINTRSLTHYLTGDYRQEKEQVTKKDAICYEIMLGLRLEKGINKNQFKNRYDIDLETIFHYKRLIKLGYLQENEYYIYIAKQYRYVSNEIIIKFLDTIENNN